MVTTGTAKHFSLKIIFFCHVLLAKSSHILFTDIIQHLFPFGCLVSLHGKPCLALKQTWCYFDFIFETGLMWSLPGFTLFVKQFCGEKLKTVPPESFHHQPCWTVHHFDLLGDHRACSCPCPGPGGSHLGAASFIGSQVVPGSHVQLSAFLGSDTKEWGPFCSAVVFFLIVSFFFFFYFDQYAEFCP